VRLSDVPGIQERFGDWLDSRLSGGPDGPHHGGDLMDSMLEPFSPWAREQLWKMFVRDAPEKDREGSE